MMPKIKGVTDTTPYDESLSALPAEAPPAATATAKTTNTTENTEVNELSHLSERELMKKVEAHLDTAIGESKFESTPVMKGFLRSVIEKHLKSYISKSFIALAYVQWHRAQLATAKKLRAELKKTATE